MTSPDAAAELFDREEDPTAETEDDLAVPETGALQRAVVTGTDWTVGTILDQLARGNIQLNPAFQRRDAWRPRRKSEFIESLFLGMPVPQIVLAERPEAPGRFLVIDGKQRLLALRQFAATEGDEYKSLSLTGLKVRPDLNRSTLEKLRASDSESNDLAAFENQTIRAVVVRAWPNEEFLFRVFYRLNSGSVPLSPQELRQALHPGPFLDFVLERSDESTQIRDVLRLTGPDFRMRDVELLIRFYAFANFLPEYTGDLKKFLDTTCMRLNADWEDESEAIREQAKECERAIDATFEIFGEHAFRRWTGQWERQFNRAVFDAVVYYFRDADVAQAAEANKDAVVEAYKTLSETNRGFVDALQTTTKTIPSTALRLSAWGGALAKVLAIPLPIPRLDGDRIVETDA